MRTVLANATHEQIAEARRLLSMGGKTGEVNKATGVSRHAVQALANGSVVEPQREIIDYMFCPGCGGYVIADKPCRLCDTRNIPGP